MPFWKKWKINLGVGGGERKFSKKEKKISPWFLRKCWKCRLKEIESDEGEVKGNFWIGEFDITHHSPQVSFLDKKLFSFSEKIKIRNFSILRKIGQNDVLWSNFAIFDSKRIKPSSFVLILESKRNWKLHFLSFFISESFL